MVTVYLYQKMYNVNLNVIYDLSEANHNISAMVKIQWFHNIEDKRIKTTFELLE